MGAGVEAAHAVCSPQGAGSLDGERGSGTQTTAGAGVVPVYNLVKETMALNARDLHRGSADEALRCRLSPSSANGYSPPSTGNRRLIFDGSKSVCGCFLATGGGGGGGGGGRQLVDRFARNGVVRRREGKGSPGGGKAGGQSTHTHTSRRPGCRCCPKTRSAREIWHRTHREQQRIQSGCVANKELPESERSKEQQRRQSVSPSRWPERPMLAACTRLSGK